jgi:hypothetical protein
MGKYSYIEVVMIFCPHIIQIYIKRAVTAQTGILSNFRWFSVLLSHSTLPPIHSVTVQVSVPQQKRKARVQYTKDDYRSILRKSVTWFSINTGHAICGWVNYILIREFAGCIIIRLTVYLSLSNCNPFRTFINDILTFPSGYFQEILPSKFYVLSFSSPIFQFSVHLIFI